MIRGQWSVAGVALLVGLVGGACAQNQKRAAWLGEARWGVFMHFLGEPGLSAEEWNKRVDDFDVEGLAGQLESVGARYFFLTLGQNSGHYLSPNRAYDRLTGIRPSKCSRRDLVADMYQALERRGIRMLVYLPAGAPNQDEAAVKALEWKDGPYRNAAFQRKWEQVIAEWSGRWGRHVSGWWFDGCYWPNAMYRHREKPNFASFAAAARAGNPDSIVAFNRGVVDPIHSQSEQEDYTAGEINDAARAEVFPDVAQTHMLSFLGKSWSAGPARFSGEQAAEYTVRMIKKGGAVTWDVPHLANGLIGEEFLRQLGAIGKALPRM